MEIKIRSAKGGTVLGVESRPELKDYSKTLRDDFSIKPRITLGLKIVTDTILFPVI